MKKNILIASAAMAVAAFGFETWLGDSQIYQVNTGFGGDDPDLNKAGYWFDYGDSKDGGQSSVGWPEAKGNGYDDNALDPIIDACKGVCGVANLSAGKVTYDPFVGVGFNVAGENGEVADATSWGGVCVAYTSEAPIALELGLGDAEDAAIKYANPAASLAKGENISEKYTWDNFKQPTWASVKISGPEAAVKLNSLKFKIQGKTGSSFKFNIMAVGPANGGTCKVTGGTLPDKVVDGGSTPSDGGNTAIGDISVSSAKAILSGRTLSFSGISNAKVEILNLQGQIVMKGSAASSMNLMGLDAGVYMVRIAGKAVNMSQKILVK